MPRRRPKIRKLSNGRHRQSYSRLRKLIRYVAFLPLFCLLLERVFFFPFEGNISGYLDVQRVAVTSTIKKKEENFPAAAVLSSLETLTQPFRVTDTSSVHCPTEGTRSIAGYQHLGVSTTLESGTTTLTGLRQKIPRILHQQGTTRCVSSALYDRSELLKHQLSPDKNDGEGWSMYFHTEDAMTRLFRAIIAAQGQAENSKHSIPSRIAEQFPHLGQILRCVKNRSFSKRIIWRFLCLYIFGGMYVNLEFPLPPLYRRNMQAIIRESPDALLLWTNNEENQQPSNQPMNKSHVVTGIDPNIIAVTPEHPLIYYALQHTILLIIADTYSVEEGNAQLNKFTQNRVVSIILERALADFLRAQNTNFESLSDEKYLRSRVLNESRRKNTYSGIGNVTVTIVDASHATGTKTASEVNFSKITEFITKAQASQFGLNAFGGERGTVVDKVRRKSPSCLLKILSDVSATK